MKRFAVYLPYWYQSTNTDASCFTGVFVPADYVLKPKYDTSEQFMIGDVQYEVVDVTAQMPCINRASIQPS